MNFFYLSSCIASGFLAPSSCRNSLTCFKDFFKFVLNLFNLYIPKLIIAKQYLRLVPSITQRPTVLPGTGACVYMETKGRCNLASLLIPAGLEYYPYLQSKYAGMKAVQCVSFAPKIASKSVPNFVFSEGMFVEKTGN